MALTYTAGFKTEFLRTRHYQKHVIDKAEFMCSEPEEYEEIADRFLGEPQDADTQEYTKKNGDEAGDVVRYNSNTQEFGVLGKDGVIITYFIADYLYGTNQEYFDLEKTKDESRL